jgi:hypothetical protein
MSGLQIFTGTNYEDKKEDKGAWQAQIIFHREQYWG